MAKEILLKFRVQDDGTLVFNKVEDSLKKSEKNVAELNKRLEEARKLIVSTGKYKENEMAKEQEALKILKKNGESYVKLRENLVRQGKEERKLTGEQIRMLRQEGIVLTQKNTKLQQAVKLARELGYEVKKAQATPMGGALLMPKSQVAEVLARGKHVGRPDIVYQQAVRAAKIYNMEIPKARRNEEAVNSVLKLRTAILETHSKKKKEALELTRRQKLEERARARTARAETQTSKTGDNMLRFLSTAKGAATAIPLYMGLGSIYSGIANSLQQAVEYEKTLKRIQIVTGQSAENIKKADDVLKNLSMNTEFSSASLAKTMLEINKTGLTMTDSYKMLGAVADLATSSMTDTETAAQAVIQVMKVYNVGVDQVTTVTRAMQTVINKTKLDFSSYTEAMKHIAPVAHTVGMNLGELNALIGILSDKGLSGSLAGTGLKNILIGLVSNKDADTLKAINQEGKSLVEILTELKDMGQSEVLENFVQIFQRRALPAAFGLGGKEVIEKYTELLKAQDNLENSPSIMAEKIRENTSDSWAKLSNTITNTFTEALQKLNEDNALIKGLNNLTSAIKPFVDWLAGTRKNVKSNLEQEVSKMYFNSPKDLPTGFSFAPNSPSGYMPMSPRGLNLSMVKDRQGNLLSGSYSEMLETLRQAKLEDMRSSVLSGTTEAQKEQLAILNQEKLTSVQEITGPKLPRKRVPAEYNSFLKFPQFDKYKPNEFEMRRKGTMAAFGVGMGTLHPDRIEAAEKGRLERKEDLTKFGVDQLTEVTRLANQIFDIQMEGQRKLSAARLAEVQRETELNLLVFGHTEEKRQEIIKKGFEKEAEQQRILQQAEEKHAKRKRALAMIEATIGTAMAVINALKSPIAPITKAAIIGGLGAIQIGVIASQKLANGGRVKGETSDNVPALLSDGERVVSNGYIARVGGQDAMTRILSDGVKFYGRKSSGNGSNIYIGQFYGQKEYLRQLKRELEKIV